MDKHYEIKILAAMGYYCHEFENDGSFKAIKLCGVTLDDHLADIIRRRLGRIPAIRHYKIVTGRSLVDAKNYVEKLCVDHGLGEWSPEGYVNLRPEYERMI